MTIQNMAIALGAWILTLILTAGVAYKHGKSYQEGLDAKIAAAQLQDNLNAVNAANDRAAAAYQTQVQNAERYAEALAATKEIAKNNHEEISNYVVANPAPTACDLTEQLFNSYNKAIDATTAFSPSRVRAGVNAGSSATAKAQ